MKISVSLTGIEAVRDSFAKLNAITKDQALRKTAVDVEAYVTREADKHTKTGALIDSVYSKRINQDSYEIGHDLQRARHALFVHWGSRPHVIKPKNKKRLRWPASGGFIFAKEVHHPGYKGDPWLKRAADLAPRIFAQHVNQLLQKV